MNGMRIRSILALFLPAAITFALTTGCGPDFRQLRREGQRALHQKNYAVARDHFDRAYRIWPEDARNLHDLGKVSFALAERLKARGNEPAAMREIDRAVQYYSRAIEAHPGMRSALAGKNAALELKGQYDAAMRGAEWAATFVGPSAREQIFLASEFEERGDYDGALLRYRQGVAMEPKNAEAHAALGRFLHRHGKTQMAVVHLNQSYELNPLDASVASLLVELGQPLPRTTDPRKP